MLVDRLDDLDRQASGSVLAGVSDDELYAAVVTVMMRVLFLLFAEERRLLPSDDDRYDTSYSVGRLVDQLEQRASLTVNRRSSTAAAPGTGCSRSPERFTAVSPTKTFACRPMGEIFSTPTAFPG